MELLTKPEYRYWLVTFAYNDAHILEADDQQDLFRNAEKTFRIHYRELRYRFIDIEKEARETVQRRKSSIDPRILFDESKTIDDLLGHPSLQGRKDEREPLAISLKISRMMPEDRKKKEIKEYDEAQEKTEEELYCEELDGLKLKQNYMPEQIRNFTLGEVTFGLIQAGYLMGKVGFKTMEDALRALYCVWEDIRNDRRKLLMVDLGGMFHAESQKRISELFGPYSN